MPTSGALSAHVQSAEMNQLALFEDEAFAGPEGLRYAREFVPDEVERELIARVAELPLKPF
jgi:hypothetical protein